MELLIKESYLAMIRNSLGSKLFRTLYAVEGGRQKDILRDGGVASAFFVSGVLHQFKLINSPHATLKGLIDDLQRSGWLETDLLEPGSVVIWEPQVLRSGEKHAHVGFAISKMSAISHSDQERVPVEHHITFGSNKDGSPVRKIVAIYALEGFL